MYVLVSSICQLGFIVCIQFSFKEVLFFINQSKCSPIVYMSGDFVSGDILSLGPIQMSVMLEII